MKHCDRKQLLQTCLKVANDYRRDGGRTDRPLTQHLFSRNPIGKVQVFISYKMSFKSLLVDHFLMTSMNAVPLWTLICSLLSAEVPSPPLPFITSEAIHSSLKQIHHAEDEISLPQLCWSILKSFAVHKSSAAAIVHLPFSCSTLQPCADKNECLGQILITSALIFYPGFQPRLIAGGSYAVGSCILLWHPCTCLGLWIRQQGSCSIRGNHWKWRYFTVLSFRVYFSSFKVPVLRLVLDKCCVTPLP